MSAPLNEAIRLWNNGLWGQRGFAIPYYPSGAPGEANSCVASNNIDVVELHDDLGKQTLGVLTLADAMSSAPPKLKTLILVHKLIQRYRSVTAGEVIASNEVPSSSTHVGANAIPFNIHPVPLFNLRNKWLKRWGIEMLKTLSELMQHQTNIYPDGIYQSLIRDTRAGLDKVYAKLGTQFFGKDKPWAADPKNTLTDADFNGYNEDIVFTSSERIDRRAGLLKAQYNDQDLANMVDGYPAAIAVMSAAPVPFLYTEPDEAPPAIQAATGGAKPNGAAAPPDTASVQSKV